MFELYSYSLPVVLVSLVTILTKKAPLKKIIVGCGGGEREGGVALLEQILALQ